MNPIDLEKHLDECVLIQDDNQCINFLEHWGLLKLLDQALMDSNTGSVCLMHFHHPSHWLRIMVTTTHVEASENGCFVFAVPKSNTTREEFVQQTNEIVAVLALDKQRQTTN